MTPFAPARLSNYPDLPSQGVVQGLIARQAIFDDLNDLLQMDAGNIKSSTDATTTDDDIDTLLERSTRRTAARLATLGRRWYWSRATHHQQSQPRRLCVQTVMLVAGRMSQRHLHLPPEMWLEILGCLRLIDLGWPEGS